MVEAVLGLRLFIDVSPISKPDLKLPRIACAEKIIELHKDNSITLLEPSKVVKMQKGEKLSTFLDKNFTQIQKIEILKKIFHGIHTEERKHALMYLQLLKKK